GFVPRCPGSGKALVVGGRIPDDAGRALRGHVESAAEAGGHAAAVHPHARQALLPGAGLQQGGGACAPHPRDATWRLLTHGSTAPKSLNRLKCVRSLASRGLAEPANGRNTTARNPSGATR